MTNRDTKAKIYRDAFENEKQVFNSEQVLFKAVSAQLSLAEDVLTRIAASEHVRPQDLASFALAQINDPKKSILDWSKEYKA